MSIEIVNTVAIAVAVSSMANLVYPLIKDWLKKLIQIIDRRRPKVVITLKTEDENGKPIEITIDRDIRSAPLSEDDIEKILIQAKGVRNES
ncbi:hypothetical protein CGK41_24360 [Vibrio parahaemolyticus]|uniref:hypothetical protein n=1 Tax=Vibrio parahaemolyticus TaxID=670 RepID=UPI0011236A20|nr:hypothetical protein [Vibrio parahaemolyticus]TNZ68001.1 hypothetical protein CGK41_24360 [Vibrio parahaemolyticus]